MITLCVQIINQATFLMYLPKPRLMVVILILIFTILVKLAYLISANIVKYFEITVPTVFLWLFPLTSLFLVYSFFLVILMGIPALFGRGFWSSLLSLNAKMTTVLFTTTFLALKIYVGISFIGAAWRYLQFWISHLENLKYGQPIAFFSEEDKRKATKFNRYAFFGVIVLLFGLGIGIIFLYPQAILYYRGMIQLKTGINSEIALETLNHLAQKYPNYRYIDSVDFQRAWILDRRLNKFQDAIIEYRKFLEKYGTDNVWAEDVTANLVRIYADELKDPHKALEHIKEHQKNFPNGLYKLHILIYEIQNLAAIGKIEEAKTLQKKSIEDNRNQIVIIYNKEDDFISAIPFEIAAKTVGI